MQQAFAIAGAIMLFANPAASAQAQSAYDRAQAAFGAHRFAEAAMLYAQAETETPGKTDALLMEGKSLANEGQFAQAESALEAYTVLHPQSAETLFMLGFVLNRENKPGDSLRTYTQAAKLATPQSDDLKVVAMDYVLLNDYDDAIRWMKQAVVFDPKNEQAWYGLGRCLYTQSEFREAQQAFQHALALEPHDVKAEANLGLAYEMDNKPDQAEAAYKAAVALGNADPHTDEWPYLDYGAFLLEHDRPADAIPLLQRAVAVAPRCAECHGKLGRALAESGQAKQGVAELRQAVALSPRDAKLHYDLGRAYRAAGELDEARAELALSAKLYGWKDSPGAKQ
ncbi:MAG: tetratricopeptide repeat protein [Acidobacteriaceae bacterium]